MKKRIFLTAAILCAIISLGPDTAQAQDQSAWYCYFDCEDQRADDIAECRSTYPSNTVALTFCLTNAEVVYQLCVDDCDWCPWD